VEKAHILRVLARLGENKTLYKLKEYQSPAA